MGLFDDEDFTHLKPVGTARYTLSQVNIRKNPKPVVLEVRHSGASNERFQNALAKMPRGADAKLSMARLFAKHVIVAWENVLNHENVPVKYTPEGGEEIITHLLNQKRDDIIMDLYAFARDADNFRDPVVDAGDLGNG